MASSRAPKQWCLTKTETANSIEVWRENFILILNEDARFAPFLRSGVTWKKTSRSSANRGLSNDGDTVPEGERLTAAQKVVILDRMLGQIANYCPIISRNSIVKNSTSLDSIWQAIRLPFCLQHTGAQFLDFADIRQEPGEKPEDLYQRLVAFIDDNLLVQGCGITHHGDTVTEDEEVTPSVENFIVLTWLRLIHQDLPRLVKQRYGPELRSRTLASIKPEISQALPSLIDELRTCEDARVMRTAADRFRSVQSPLSTLTRSPKPKPASRVCPLCKQSKRPKTDHFLSACPFLPEQDREYILRARIVTGVDDLALCENSVEEEIDDPGYDIPYTTGPSEPATVRRVMIKESPHLNMFRGHVPI